MQIEAMASAEGPPANVSRDYTSFVGMVIFLGGWAMMFAALFFAYATARVNAPVWPPEGVAPLPVAWPALNTVVLLASSVTLHLSLTAIRNWSAAALRRWLVATLALGALFLALQLKVWLDVWGAGLTIRDGGIYGSLFYMMTTVHAAHVLAGLLALLVVTVKAYRGTYRRNRHNGVRMAGMFWHFIDVVWVAMFFAVYVL